MAALRALGVAVALVWAAPLPAQKVAVWRAHIAEASARFGVPIAWIERVMQAESAGRTERGGRPIVSRAGAMGLMQVMPATWAALRRQHGLGNDPFDPRDNILAGAAYLRAMYDRFGYPGLFAAYNAGPARYAEYLAGDRRLPGETRAYLAAVTGTAASVKAGAAGPVRPPALTPPSVFAVLKRTDPVLRAAGSAAGSDGLFVALSPAVQPRACASAADCR